VTPGPATGRGWSGALMVSWLVTTGMKVKLGQEPFNNKYQMKYLLKEMCRGGFLYYLFVL
jgi:hypothetical protein